MTNRNLDRMLRNESLSDNMERWADLRHAADDLEAVIKSKILELGEDKRTEYAVARISSRGRYDWQRIAYQLEPDEQVIDACTIHKVDWKKVAARIGVPEDLKTAYYEPGKPTVNLKLIS